MSDLSDAVQVIVLVVFAVATSIWVGGLVAIAVVARTATAVLDPAGRVAFFRSLGPTYLRVGGGALVVMLASGAVLLSEHAWDGTMLATVLVGVALVLSLAAGVVQARRMTKLRRAALAAPEDTSLAEQVRRGSAGAHALRGIIAALSLVLLVLGAVLAV